MSLLYSKLVSLNSQMSIFYRRLVIGTGFTIGTSIIGFKIIEYRNIKSIRNYWSYFYKINPFFLTEKTCIAAIEENPQLISKLTEKQKTGEVCERAIEMNPTLLRYIPPHRLTETMCIKIVERKPNLLPVIPKEKQTNHILKIAAEDTATTNNFVGMTMTGKEFNKLFHNVKFVKLTNPTETHNGFRFKSGLNVDTIPFDDKCECCPGGFYFTNEQKKEMWIKTGAGQETNKFERPVTIPDDAKVHFENNKIKTDKFILGEPQEIKIRKYNLIDW